MSRQSSGDVGFTQAVNISPTNRPLTGPNNKADNAGVAAGATTEGIQMVVLSKETKNCNSNGGVVIAAADVEHPWKENSNNGTTTADNNQNGSALNNKTKVQVSHV